MYVDSILLKLLLLSLILGETQQQNELTKVARKKCTTQNIFNMIIAFAWF